MKLLTRASAATRLHKLTSWLADWQPGWMAINFSCATPTPFPRSRGDTHLAKGLPWLQNGLWLWACREMSVSRRLEWLGKPTDRSLLTFRRFV